MDRRKFIESAGRWGIIGLMGLVVGILIRRNAVTMNTDCAPEMCQNCGKRESCRDVINNVPTTNTDANSSSTDARSCVSTPNKLPTS